MPGITLDYVKSTPGFHVYEARDPSDGVGRLYVAKAKMGDYAGLGARHDDEAEPRVRVTWPEPPESGR